MTKSFFSATVLSLTLLSASLLAAGSRRGPVWQFGTVMYPVRQISVTGESSERHSSGVGRSILVGYGITPKLLVLAEFEHSTLRSKVLGNSRAFYDFTGLTAQRYLSGSLNRMYVTAGLGALSLYVADDDYSSVGPAFLVGGGYEFVEHAEVAVRYTYGRTKYLGDNVSHQLLSFVISAKVY